VALRDDKSYPFLKLTTNEKFPRLFITRIRKADGARYFGPYTEARLLRQAVTFLKWVFPLRVCKTMPKTACLNLYLKQCLAPCIERVNKKGYDEVVDQLTMFLEGRRPELLKHIEKKMIEASKDKGFEEAARLRDQLKALTQAIVIPKQEEDETGELEALKEILRLKRLPQRIEAFDCSNISGKEAVGSMVTFLNGKPHKSGYRRFKIKTVAGVDDYQMMREIIRRRYQHLIQERKHPPDFIVIDGGKGHLSSAQDELKKLDIHNIPMIGIAKEFEHIYVPGRAAPIKLTPSSYVLHLIQRIRDEAHRFAIEYHKGLRSKLTSVSELDGIRGVGQKRKIALIKHFGSVGGIKGATTSDLMDVKGINESVAERVKEALS